MNKNLRVVPGMIFLLFVTLTEAAAQYEIQTTPVRTHRGYIHLQDGTILKGRYAYSASLEKIRVISDHQIRVFDASEVSRITIRRPSQFASTASPGEVPEMPGLPPTLWFNHTELGVLAGNDDNKQVAPLVFGTSMNRIIYKNLSAGAGLGAEFLGETYMPLTLNLMYRLRHSRYSPFAMVQGGYQVPLEGSRTLYQRVVPHDVYSSIIWPGPTPTYNTEMKARGGFLFNPAFGIMKNNGQGFGTTLSFGYRFHRLRYAADNHDRIDADFNRLTIKLGFIFN
ncbi:MAG TPA: hypothetical protein PLX49_00870 [Prolixibacteraceae bacterium]|nr:hypothetical protein [Prolixibacteraceae bacterium]